MGRFFVIVFSLIISQLLFTVCISRHEGEANYHKDVFLSQCDSLIGSYPDIVVRKIDSVISVSGINEDYYSLLLLKAKAKLFLSEYDSVEIFLDGISEFLNNSQNENISYKLLSNVNNMRGNLYARRAVMDSAVYYFENAYKNSSMLGLSRDLIDISINLADSYVRCGKFDLGAYWYRKSLLISDSLQIPEKERFPSFYGLAQVYMDLRDYKHCDYYFDKAGFYYDLMLPFEKHIYLNNRGNSYYYRGDYEKSMEYFRKSLALANSYPDMEFERNFTKVNMGEVFMLMNETDSATLYLEDCYSFFKSINQVSALYYIETQLIELALKKGEIKLASNIINNAVKPDFIEPNMLLIRNKYLQHYFEESGDYKNAYIYQTKNVRMDDSIRNERIKMHSAEISLKYKQDSTLMKKEIFIKEKESQVLILHQWIYVLILSLLLIVSLLCILIIFRKRRTDKKIWNMRKDISSLRLENIRNRISPHFIFNVLNREVVRFNNEEDKNSLVNLSKLIRKNLELTGNLSISLYDELDFVKTYISLQEQTMGSDFHYEINIMDDMSLYEIQIPSMLIQIPVENALKHALRIKKGDKKLWIRINKDADKIYISITDNGGGFKQISDNRGTGTGLKVVTQSIQLLNMYNKVPITMRIVNVPLDNSETGCEIRYSLPLDYSYNISK